MGSDLGTRVLPDARNVVDRHERQPAAARVGRPRADLDAPVLVVQGSEDPYGTLAQVEAIERGVSGPAERAILPGVGHRPQKDAPEATLAAITAFVKRARG